MSLSKTDRPRSSVSASMGILLLLAWRNLWRARRRTLITMTSISLGFAIAVLFIGIGDGAHNSMIRNAIKMGNGHLVVQQAGYQKRPANHKFLKQAARWQKRLQQVGLPGHVEPRVIQQVLVSSPYQSVGATLEGFDPQVSVKRTMIEPNLIAGAWLNAEDKKGVLIGSDMARKLKIKPSQKLVIMTSLQGESISQMVRVRGVFETGIQMLDEFVVYTTLASTQHLLSPSESVVATLLAIYLDQPDDLEYWAGQLETLVQKEQSDIEVLTWQETMPQLVQFIALDDAGNYVFLIFILVMVVFGIANTILMSVLERTHEFGMLRALGLTRGRLLFVVFSESVFLALMSVLLGWCAGLLLHLWFSTYGLDLSGMMGESTSLAGTVMDSVIYTELSARRIIQLSGIVFLATVLTGLYPAFKAIRVAPVEAIRN